MVATVAKIALIVFLVLAVCVIVVVYVRNSRGGRGLRFRSNSHVAQVHGAMPETPLPEWAADNEATGDRHRDPPGR